MVGIETTSSTAELSHRLNSVQQINLTLQTLNKDLELLAQAGWRCRLTVSVSQHRNLLPLLSKSINLVYNIVQRRQVDIGQSLLQQEWSGCVVDILRCKTEVYELAVVVQAQLLQLLLQEVLDSLHIVVCYALNLLHMQSILHSKLGVELTQLLESRLGNTCQLWQRQLAQSDEILHFHTNTITNKCVL